jgi:hypothetical protein
MPSTLPRPDGGVWPSEGPPTSPGPTEVGVGEATRSTDPESPPLPPKAADASPAPDPTNAATATANSRPPRPMVVTPRRRSRLDDDAPSASNCLSAMILPPCSIGRVRAGPQTLPAHPTRARHPPVAGVCRGLAGGAVSSSARFSALQPGPASSGARFSTLQPRNKASRDPWSVLNLALDSPRPPRSVLNLAQVHI